MNNVKWKDKCKDLKWVCGVKTYNSELTIYSCLKAAAKTFKNIIVTDDGSKDKTFDEIKKFIDENKNINIAVFNLDTWDPLPDLSIKRDHGSNIESHPISKTHSKAQIKNFIVCKKYFPDALYFSLEDDVILYNNIKERIFNRIKDWKNPSTDSEFFNLVNIVNSDYVRVGNTTIGMNRRKLYENAGDWTFCCFWLGGNLSIGPDPIYPWGACLFPWLPKNQLSKKGQDNTFPFGLHLLYYRNNKNNTIIEDGMKRVSKIKDLEDKHIDTEVLSNLNSKVKIDLDSLGKLSIIKK